MNIPNNDFFKDKVVVITGAGGVLCGVLAKAYAMVGCKVALLDLNYEKANECATLLNKEGKVAKAYECNVLDQESIKNAHQNILNDFGKCDILVNGAGGNNPKAQTDNEFFNIDDVGKMKTFFDLDQSGIEFVFNLNYMGTLLPTKEFASDMLGREGCNILNISSMNAFTPLTKIPAYSGAKSAVSNLTQWLAVHFSKVNIRCNAIAPGFFVTNQNQKLLFNEDGMPSLRSEKILRNTPMDRFGKAEELIGATLFLTNNDTASFINGVILPIDGGFSAYSGV